jgi:hypothetical protein
LRKEHRLRVIDNRLLKKIFGPKRSVVTGDWKRLHNEEVYDLCSWLSMIQVMEQKNEIGRACDIYVEKGGVVQSFGWEAKGKETTGEI